MKFCNMVIVLGQREKCCPFIFYLGYLVTDDGAKPVWIFSLEFAHYDVNFYIYDAVSGENIYDIHKSN